MKRIFSILMLCSLSAQAKNINYKDYYKESKGCFIVYNVNENKTIEEYNSKLCKTPTPPNSTFKIVLSVMGFDKKILENENKPKWEFKEEYLPDGFESWMPVQWKEPNTPSTWLKYSVLWYSQKLAPMIGSKEITDYLNKFDYGNKDFSGSPEKKEKYPTPWVDSSLKITSENQIQFLKKLVTNKLPVSNESMQMTKKILFIEENKNKASLYGKTGAGYLENRVAHGWFIGWVEKNNNKYLFVSKIIDNKSGGKLNSVIAKENAIEFLTKLKIL